MAYWIWYPEDYELYHARQQNYARTERDYSRPAFWNLADCYHTVVFTKTCRLEHPETIRIYARGLGEASVNGQRFGIRNPILCPAGEVQLNIIIFNKTGLPALYVDGETIQSDASWYADPYLHHYRPVGLNEQYTSPDDDPSVFPYSTRFADPVQVTAQDGGLLFDFGTELYARIHCLKRTGWKQKFMICFGESDAEALDPENCYHYDEVPEDVSCFHSELRAFRYLFVPGAKTEDVHICAEHEYVDRAYPTAFRCRDALVSKIWDVAVNTFDLNSRAFFLDGIKRDGWIWSGDAYQSYFINQYLYMDPSVNRRTMIALFGRMPIEQHINTILDYSLLWMLSIRDHCRTYDDPDFLKTQFPKMKAMLEYAEGSRDENGFLIGRPGDWIFVDWADIDKTGALCAEQILYFAALHAAADAAEMLGEPAEHYRVSADALKEKILRFYWDEEQGALIDSFASGRRHVTRHANIFAILFDFADEAHADSILHRVLLNPEVAQITTPYFKFFELDAFAKLGRLDYVWEEMLRYWGDMVKLGCSTFWEEYDPSKSGIEHYAMYGNKFEKSLCHAWGASPIYLLGRYFAGLYPTAPGYASFTVRPDLHHLHEYTFTLPLPDGKIDISCTKEQYRITADRAGGTLELNGRTWVIRPGEPICVSLMPDQTV